MRTLRLTLAVLALAVSLATPAAARTPEAGRNTVEFDNQQRVYHLHLPPAYDGETPLPLVLVLHGGGGNGPRIARQTDFEAKADAEGFVVVFPTGQEAADSGHYWTAGDVTNDPVKAALIGDDVAFLSALIDQLTDDLAIDEQRIYVTGFSNGAAMTHKLACALSDRIAAAAAVASALSAECDPVSPVAVLQMNGSEDPHFQEGGTIEVDGQQIDHWYAIEVWSEYNGCPVEPVLTIVDRVTTETHGPCAAGTEVVRITIEGVGHNWPGGPSGPDDPIAATDAVWGFFARHAKAGEATPVAADAGA